MYILEQLPKKRDEIEGSQSWQFSNLTMSHSYYLFLELIWQLFLTHIQIYLLSTVYLNTASDIKVAVYNVVLKVIVEENTN